MELPDDAPKLPKLPFIVGDIVFLGIAAYLIQQADSPPSTASIVGIVVCAGIGVALGLAPFIADYSRKQDQQLTERQSALEALVRTTSSAADQAGIAASGLNEIAEITKRNLHTIDELPARIEAARQSVKNVENHQHATAVEALRTDFDQLREEQAASVESTTELLEKLIDQMAALEKRVADRLDALEAELKTVAATTFSAAVPPAPAAPPSPVTAPPPLDLAAKTGGGTTDLPSPNPEKPKSRKPTAKAPPPPEPSLFDATASDEIAAVFELEPQSPSEDEVDEPDDMNPDEEVDEDAIADDSDFDAVESPGADFNALADKHLPPTAGQSITRITVTAYIGIGNRLFVRGDGPGLSPNEGTPLQFVSIGKWRWETDAATQPMKLTIWKNDQELCTSLGELQLRPGAQLETSANF